MTAANYLKHTVCLPTTGYTAHYGSDFTVPSGGTWIVLCHAVNYNSTSVTCNMWFPAGGVYLNLGSDYSKSAWWAWRIS